jgi:hypothetical protein
MTALRFITESQQKRQGSIANQAIALPALPLRL